MGKTWITKNLKQCAWKNIPQTWIMNASWPLRSATNHSRAPKTALHSPFHMRIHTRYLHVVIQYDKQYNSQSGRWHDRPAYSLAGHWALDASEWDKRYWGSHSRSPSGRCARTWFPGTKRDDSSAWHLKTVSLHHPVTIRAILRLTGPDVETKTRRYGLKLRRFCAAAVVSSNVSHNPV